MVQDINSDSSVGQSMEEIPKEEAKDSYANLQSPESTPTSGARSDQAKAASPQEPETKIEKSVRFKEIHIRDYERVVGDNPSCSSGPPIG